MEGPASDANQQRTIAARTHPKQRLRWCDADILPEPRVRDTLRFSPPDARGRVRDLSRGPGGKRRPHHHLLPRAARRLLATPARARPRHPLYGSAAEREDRLDL